MEGQFRLQANAGAEASKPETIRVQNAKGAISLARLDDSPAPKLDEQLDESIPETTIAPAVVEEEEEEPEPLPPPPPPPPPPVKKLEPKAPEPSPEPTPMPELLDETPAPDTLPLVEEPPEELVLPLLKDTLAQFWTVESIEEAFEFPLLLPLTGARPSFDPKRWQSILRISVRGSSSTIVVKREPGALGMFFYLRELQSILPQANLDGLQLVVESGVKRRGENESEIRVTGQKTSVTIRSLQNAQGVTLQIDGWRFVEPTDQWIRSAVLTKPDAVIHLLEPLMLTELEGYLRGAKAFVVQSLQPTSQLAVLHFVRGKSIVASTDTTDEKFMKSLARRLRADLVYRGSFQAFLGGKGSFDLNNEANRLGDLYYVRRNSLLKLDRNLFKTHSAARAFIKNFDPYFMSMPVDILFHKE